MKGPLVDILLHKTLFPNPKQSDPPTFAAFLTRNLIPEVRLETACFYGDLSAREAQYPGLNYTYAPHRARLSRFPWHRRLFRAIDALGLTDAEVLGLTRWEGTLWARRRFERENGVVVRDTTGEDVGVWVPGWRGRSPTAEEEGVSDEEESEESEETREDQDAGVASLDARLRIAVDQRRVAALAMAGRAQSDSVSLRTITEEWEQWLKEASEGGDAAAPEVVVRRLLAQRDGIAGGALAEYLSAVVRGGERLGAGVVVRREEGVEREGVR